uniref:Uncharacterized protein n=1 Tax=Hippocampus comes TaxID=109280 RepID=A0A3Q3DPV9_HIPCM
RGLAQFKSKSGLKQAFLQSMPSCKRVTRLLFRTEMDFKNDNAQSGEGLTLSSHAHPQHEANPLASGGKINRKRFKSSGNRSCM